ncbi:MAG: aspartate aminotransferase family protein [Gammaproteobacteria bacterium]
MDNFKLTPDNNAATADYRRLDAAHYLHPFTDGGALGAGARIITRGEGVYLWDSDGCKLLDGMSGLWCVNMGYGREEIAGAVSRQIRELPYYNSFFQCATPPAIELAAKLAEIAPDGFSHVFFTGSGSEANDTVVRMIRRYWELRGEPRRKIIISRKNAYHGSTIAGASLGGMAQMHAQGGLPIPGIVHAKQPYWFEEGRKTDANEFGILAARAVEDKIRENGAENIAAFIGEPVQGAGGVIIPPDSYWPEVRRICAEYNIPIVADEVICGFGRLGRWFGSEYFNIGAKLMPVAKGMTSGYLPMGGVLVHDDIAEIIIDKGGEFAHGFTYSGHPVCAAAALANLELMQKENIVEKVRADTAPYFQQQWQTLAAHPLVGEARGAGMMAALEIVADKESGARFPAERGAGAICRDNSAACGLVMRAVRDTMIAAPPLVITRAQTDELITKAAAALDKTQKALGR